jgi:integrase
MSGSIRERRPGVWELRAYTGRDPDTGKPRQVSRIFRGGKRAADQALARLVTEVADGKIEVTNSVTFGRLDEWMRRYVERHRAKATIETYRIHVEKYIKPELGSIKLTKLTAYHLDRYFERLEEIGLAASTIKLDHAVVSGSLSQAVKWGWVKSNPAKIATIRQVQKVDAPALSVKQLRTLYFAALEDDPDMATVIALAAITGCRRGELCGLQWGDYDPARQCLKVERAWVPGTGGQHLTTPKTGKARTVFVGLEGSALIDRYRSEKVEMLGREPDPKVWLLSLDGGETPMRAKSLTAYVTRLGNAQGIPVHFHSLRHFAATELVHAGVDLPTAAGHLGHSPAVMAGVYLHSSDERGAKAGELMAGIVAGALSGSAQREQAKEL